MSQVTEDTPLLSDPTADESGSPHDEQLESTVARHQQRCAVAIFILTWLSAILDIVLIVLYGLMIAIHKSGFGKPIPWEQDIILNGLIFAVCIDLTHIRALHLDYEQLTVAKTADVC